MNWRKKSVTILAAFTLLLGILLAALAVREAEREKLAREREQTGERKRYAVLFTAEIESLFSGIEEKIQTALSDPLILQDENKIFQACLRISENEPLINNIFLTGARGEVIFTLWNRIFSSAEKRNLARNHLKAIEKSALFKAAESAELAAGNLPLAVRSYRALLDSVSDVSTKALVMNRLARSRLKAGQFDKALRNYRSLLEDYSREMSSEGIPMGVIAFIQIISIIRKTEPQKAAGILLEFYERLLGDEWHLGKTQFQLYRSMILDMRESGVMENPGDGIASELAKTLALLDVRAEAKLMDLESEENLLERVIPLAATRASGSGNDGIEFSRFSETVGEALFLISAASLSNSRILGIALDDSNLVHERIPEIFNRLPIPEHWVVRVVDASGRTIAGPPWTSEDSLAADVLTSFTAEFDGNFPPWQVHIDQEFPGALNRLYWRRRNVYLLVVLLMMAILFFGGSMAIRSTAKELEVARLKSEFVSAVSHELRTPLMSIRYLSEMLDRDRVKDGEKKKVYFGKIHRESERLSRLIENMLDFSKIEAGMKRYRFEKTGADDLARDAAARFKEYMVDKSVNLEAEIPDYLPEIRADSEGLSRALFNLFDNAVKYSGKTPKIHFRVSVDDSDVVFEVRDEGIGIDKNVQKRVFEKFYRSTEPHSKNIEGSGLGLTLVDHIVRAHGGKVSLESDAGKGTRVTLKLPIARKGNEDESDTDR